MKKLLAALAVAAAFTGSAFAADLPARTYTKAPAPMAAVYNWTGFYVFGGAGGGLWDADTTVVDRLRGCVAGISLCGFNQTQGGNGWFGTVGAGYDWQFSGRWVAGIFGDGQFGSIRGTIQDQQPFFAGRENLRDSWAAGIRVGYLVAPNVLSYVNAGYSGSNWSGTQMFDTRTGAPVGVHTDSFNRNGWFIGGGVENNLDIFGITAPGWFMKTEYRSAFYDTKQINELVNGTNVPFVGFAGGTGDAITFKPMVQTISTSLVYRFNWTGPVVAKY
ncbi:MAG: porin family protein [Bradyrhizobium sp.]|uniref:outer membrane protein n=1 Tax=Bradyrhizobium sp. TaxID=376 RepID=UPI001DAB7E9D|nr:porin family protein [Bradyrhizobium sp.]MBV9562751.1 porin family protein [Bradyrhizobium sp.]